jgi:cobalt/nickel transport system permease protein
LVAPPSAALLVATVRVFSSGTTVWFVWDLGPWQLTATREGLAAGLLIGSRVLGGVAVMLRLSGTMTFEELVAVLEWFRVPRTWLEISLLMYRYVFQFFEQGAEVVSAQKIRLGYAGVGSGLQSLGSLAGIVLLRSMEQAERTCEAMVARGGDGLIPLPTLPPATRKMWSHVALRATGIAGVFLLAERWL